MAMALRFRERHPDHRSQEVSAAIRRGREFLRHSAAAATFATHQGERVPGCWGCRVGCPLQGF
jgi:hypothetical protein